jgi:CRP/FNR family transcriptional regulator
MIPAEAAAVARRFPAFAAAITRADSSVAERMMVKHLPAGAMYLREGDRCAGIALVLEGRLRVAKSSRAGREITLYHIVPGETCILTASCLLSGAVYPAHASVVDHVTAALIPADMFHHLFETEPAVRSFVFDHFADRLAATMTLLEEVAFRRVDQRAARWLVETADAHHVVALSHEEIAAQLGTARVVVSRLLEDFQSRGWVILGRRRVEIGDSQALLTFSNKSD